MSGAMMLLLVFVAVCCTPAAFGEEVRTSKWSYVFTALSKSPAADNAEEANNALVSAIGGSLLTCDPGWTGQFCENPICSSRNTLTLRNPGQANRVVDITTLSNCAGSLQFPHDSLSNYSYIAVTSDGGYPLIVLTDFNGAVVGSAESIAGSTYHHAFYRGIPVGTYSVSINLTIGTATYCLIEVNAYSQVAMLIGFVTEAQSDFPASGQYPTDNVPSYFVAHAFNLPFPGSLSSVTIVKDGSMTYRAMLGKRYACAYESFAGWFTCNAGSRYIAKLEGIDYNGNPLRRSSDIFGCLLGTTTQAPTTTSPPPISQCLNGGTLLYANSPEAYCY
uniref:MD domain-containing protein n=1 Tax=Plectus sambesii TaxID=2011161 RepID=A0A914XEM9_9BILA